MGNLYNELINNKVRKMFKKRHYMMINKLLEEIKMGEKYSQVNIEKVKGGFLVCKVKTNQGLYGADENYDPTVAKTESEASRVAKFLLANAVTAQEIIDAKKNAMQKHLDEEAEKDTLEDEDEEVENTDTLEDIEDKED